MMNQIQYKIELFSNQRLLIR